VTHGHDVHFLERLERLSTPQTELALSLYQDPLLIRALLEQIRLPEGAARVALSLGDGERGPFVVVARDGHFVTCLAEGMSPGDHPVIPRGQLDAIARRVAEVRNRFDAVRQLAGPRGNVFALLGRIFSAGPWLSREEFSAIAAFQPLLKRDFLRLLWETNALLDRTRPLASRCVKRGRLGDDILRAWWNEVWAVGHLSVLASMDSRDVITELPAEAPERGLLSWPAVRQGVVAVALRGLWGVAKLGRPVLPDHKRWYVQSESSLELVDSALGLLGIGLRHRGATRRRRSYRPGKASCCCSPACRGSRGRNRRISTGRRNTWKSSARSGIQSKLPVCFETRRWRTQQPSRHESRLRPAAASHVRAARARSTSVAMGSDPRAGYLSRPEVRHATTGNFAKRCETRPEIGYRHGGKASRW
jgi:hypothetical protein